MTSTLQYAIALFAKRDCRIPTREEVLVGLLRGAISEAIAIQGRVHEASGCKLSPPRLFAVDLNLKGREAKTGGDLALLLDVRTLDGTQMVIPICLQAKRAAPYGDALVSIARKNKSDEKGDHQLRALRDFADEGCNCAYVFFNNHVDFVLGSPLLPLVKSVEDIATETNPLLVDLACNTIDFASYVAYLLSNGMNSLSDLGDLRRRIVSLVGRDISHLIMISPREDTWSHVMESLGPKRSNYTLPSRQFWSRGPVDFEASFMAENSYASSEMTKEVLDTNLEVRFGDVDT